MVSQKISVGSIEDVSSVLRRAPVIWDNIHANDYDPQRLFLGPYKVKACSALLFQDCACLLTRRTVTSFCVRTVPQS